MLPLLGVMIAVVGWPLADTVRLSFTDARLIGTQGQFVGFENYQRSITGLPFLDALVTTAIFALVSVGIELVLGIPAALLLGGVRRSASGHHPDDVKDLERLDRAQSGGQQDMHVAER